MSPSSTSRLADSVPNSGLKKGKFGQNGAMRLSSSLQDLPSFSRMDPEKGDVKFEIEEMYSRQQFSRVLTESGGSSFSKEKPLVESPFKRRKCRLLWYSLGVIFLMFLLCVAALRLRRYWSESSSKYIVVLDCGSTGTRAYVYESSVDYSKGSGHLSILLKSLPESVGQISGSQSGRAYQRMETVPGFDKLVRNESGLRSALNPLLRYAVKQIPKNAHKRTSVFVYATAGVRRLPSSESEWLLDNVWSILKGYSFSCQRGWIRTISGLEEAFYGWVALNYQMGTLDSLPPSLTFGSLDLGGSSLQVTFETKDLIPGKNSLNATIGAINHHLSAYSLPGYGLNDAFDKSVAHLLREQSSVNDGMVEIKHPCLHAGYKERYVCGQCAVVGRPRSPHSRERSTGKSQSGIPVTLVGQPKWEECRALAKKTVNLSEGSSLTPVMDCGTQPCALPNGFPRPHGKFYAMSGFFVVYKFFSLTPDSSLKNLLAKGKKFCETTWEVAKSSVPAQPFIDQYCFRAPYIVSLLRDGLHIDDNQVSIGSGSITWTLGVALLGATETPTSKVHLYDYGLGYPWMRGPVLSIFILFSLLLLFFAISYAGKCIPRVFQRSYLPVFRMRSGSSSSILNLSNHFALPRWNPLIYGMFRFKNLLFAVF